LTPERPSPCYASPASRFAMLRQSRRCPVQLAALPREASACGPRPWSSDVEAPAERDGAAGAIPEIPLVFRHDPSITPYHTASPTAFVLRGCTHSIGHGRRGWRSYLPHAASPRIPAAVLCAAPAWALRNADANRRASSDAKTCLAKMALAEAGMDLPSKRACRRRVDGFIAGTSMPARAKNDFVSKQRSTRTRRGHKGIQTLAPGRPSRGRRG